MSQRLAVIISVALTAFVLVVAGAVAGRVSQTPPAATQAVDAAAAPEPDSSAAGADAAGADLDIAGVSPAIAPSADLPSDREAAYQDLIREANERLEAAYARLREQQGAAQQGAQQGGLQAVAPAPVTPDQAAGIALSVAPGGALLIAPPELVNYQGTAAYKVTLDLGLVYVDAQTGQVLYNGTVYPYGALGSNGPSRAFAQDTRGTDTTVRSGDDGGEQGDDGEGEDEHEDDKGGEAGDNGQGGEGETEGGEH